ncbi:PCMD domain-containing protein [Bacteroides ovatus]|nr:PCMD domain-containing protein [Bacteroides ovatus]
MTAEDGTVKVYTAFVEGTRKVLKYSFEDWKEGSKNDELLPKDLWAGSAAGAGILGGTLLRKETREDGTYAAKLITFEYPNEPNSLVPKITAGSIFIGKFDMMPALQGDRLSCTKFGLDAETVSLGGKPLCFKGVYKYESGSNYLDASNYEDVKPVDIKDKGQIQAVLYKVQTGEDGKLY